MKVVHLLAWYFPDTLGGTEVYAAELAARQRAAGLDVLVAAPDDRSATSRCYRWDGTAVFRYPIADTARIDEWLERQRGDIVHVHSLSTGVGLPQIAAARRSGARVIFTAHLPSLGFICQRGTLLRWGTELCDGAVDPQLCAACTLQQRGMPRAMAPLFVTSAQPLARWSSAVPGRMATAIRMTSIIEENVVRQRRLLDGVDFFVGLNERALSIVRANGAPASKLVLNRLGVGIEPDSRPRSGNAGRPLRVGFIGRVHETKGIDILARALLAIPADVPIVVEVCGPRDPADETLGRMLADAAARDARLIVRGEIARAEVADALRRIDVLCCPSMWFENGPTVALEAQAVGTPVIGSDAGAMPEFITDGVNGRIVPAGRWEPLRDALQDVALNPSVVDEWRRALPKPRTMDDVAREYEELYARALRSKHQPVAAI